MYVLRIVAHYLMTKSNHVSLWYGKSVNVSRTANAYNMANITKYHNYHIGRHLESPCRWGITQNLCSRSNPYPPANRWRHILLICLTRAEKSLGTRDVNDFGHQSRGFEKCSISGRRTNNITTRPYQPGTLGSLLLFNRVLRGGLARGSESGLISSDDGRGKMLFTWYCSTILF
jgi:hypothetical protein